MPENVIELLTADHREVKDLVEELLMTEHPDKRRELADTVIGQLVRHSVAEETIVYPMIRLHVPNGDEAVKHDIDEHKQLELVMKQMEDCPTGEPEFLNLVGRLKQVLDDHVSDEEQQQFPQLRAHMTDEHLSAMGLEVELLKKVAPTRPHPNAPNSALFHLTVGPGIGMVDRLRDALSTKTHS